MFKRLWKNEKGLTLIELLAVVVILGIIAGIAVPSIGGIIDNTKRDAHVANARQIIASAKMALAADATLLPTVNGNHTVLTLNYLQTNSYIDPIMDPDTNTVYTSTAITGDFTDVATAPTVTNNSFVDIEKTATGITYTVTLTGNSRNIPATPETALDRNDVAETE